jgi:hypothetical protein
MVVKILKWYVKIVRALETKPGKLYSEKTSCQEDGRVPVA